MSETSTTESVRNTHATLLKMLLVAAGLLVATPDSARAQEDGSMSAGLSVGGDLIAVVMRTRPVARSQETPTGVGLRGVVAYGVDSDWSIFGAVQTISVRTGSAESLKQVEAGARFTFLDDDSPARPYVEGALAFRQLGLRVNVPGPDDARAIVNGGAVTMGGGVQLFATKRFAMDVALLVATGNFDQPRLSGERVRVLSGSVPSTTLRLGVRRMLGRTE